MTHKIKLQWEASERTKKHKNLPKKLLPRFKLLKRRQIKDDKFRANTAPRPCEVSIMSCQLTRKIDMEGNGCDECSWDKTRKTAERINKTGHVSVNKPGLLIETDNLLSICNTVFVPAYKIPEMLLCVQKKAEIQRLISHKPNVCKQTTCLCHKVQCTLMEA